MANVKKLVLGALLALSLGAFTAAANPYIWLDDTGLDAAGEEFYMALALEDGHMVIRLGEAASDGALPAARAIVVTDLEDANVMWMGDGSDGAGPTYMVGRDGFEITHRGIAEDAIAGYTAVFEALGYEVTVADTAWPTVKIASFSNGSSSLEGRFTARTQDVVVRLRSR